MSIFSGRFQAKRQGTTPNMRIRLLINMHFIRYPSESVPTTSKTWSLSSGRQVVVLLHEVTISIGIWNVLSEDRNASSNKSVVTRANETKRPTPALRLTCRWERSYS